MDQDLLIDMTQCDYVLMKTTKYSTTIAKVILISFYLIS